jgi:hypothetical protein
MKIEALRRYLLLSEAVRCLHRELSNRKLEENTYQLLSAQPDANPVSSYVKGSTAKDCRKISNVR